jgi:2-polyprenyl-3-methyl-5-hydroxy-6-metoxy-1,4-benzoquinol methylase
LSNMDTTQAYWDQRYKAEGKIWGEKPSLTALYALKLFQKAGVKSIMVPGSGYGRHTAFFSKAGFRVTGIEISSVAVDLARKFDPLSHFNKASVLEMAEEYGQFDAIYCFNVLHLFLETQRISFIQGCADRMNKNGLMFFTVFSEKEVDFGKGKAVEENTFETRPGRPAHYFTEDDLRRHFAPYQIKDTGLMEDPEDHGGKPHTHILRYLCVII